MVSNHTHGRLVNINTGSEAKGPLDSVPMVISCYVAPSASISCLGPNLLLPTSSPVYLTPTPHSTPHPPLLTPPSCPLLQSPPVPITAALPAFPADAPPSNTAPVSDESQLSGLWYPGSRGLMSPLPLYLLLTLTPPKVGTPTAPLWCSMASSLLDSMPPCVGTPQSSAQY